MKISEINIVTFFIIGMFFSLFLFTNNFNLLKINLFVDDDDDDDDEYNFSIDTLQIEKASALETKDNTHNSQIINNNDTKENEKNIMFNSSKEGGLEKDSNKETQDQKEEGEEDDNNNLDLKNTTLQNAGLSTTTTTTKSSNSIGGFNFAAAGDWACTSKAKDTVKNIIDHDTELVLALGDLSYDSGAKCWLKIIKPIAEKTKNCYWQS